MISEPLLISHLKQTLTEWTCFSFYGEPPPKLITHFVSCFLSSENCYCRDDRKHNICQTKMLLVWVTLCTQIIESIFWRFHDMMMRRRRFVRKFQTWWELCFKLVVFISRCNPSVPLINSHLILVLSVKALLMTRFRMMTRTTMMLTTM